MDRTGWGVPRKNKTQLQVADKRYLLKQKSDSHVQTLLKCKILCLVVPASTHTNPGDWVGNFVRS